MKILKTIGLTLLAIIIVLVVISVFLPSKVYVERSTVINASPEVVFEQVNNLKNWEKWSPWHEIDTNMTIEYEGPEAGTGASYKWSSEHPKVGTGSLTITASAPYDSIVTEMNFMEQGKCNAIYKFEKTDNGLKITWGMNADLGMNPVSKFFGLMMDKMIGADFEKGLNKLKALSESQPTLVEIKIKIEPGTVASQRVITIRDTTSGAEISTKLMELYAEIGEFIEKNKLTQIAPPFAVYHGYSPETVDLEAGIPVGQLAKATGRVNAKEISAGNVVIANYYGPYEGTEKAHQAIDEWIKKNNKIVIGAPWEVYVTDPATEPDQSKWHTQIYYPIQ